MEVLNAAGLAPLSLPKNSAFPDKRPELKKLLPFPFRPSKPSASVFVSFSSILSAASSARALSYEEALNQTVGFSTDFDLGGIVDGVLKFGSENPLILAGGAAVVVVPLIVSQILGSSQDWGVETAKSAYAKLGEDAGAQLLDIREGKDLREVGSPDVRGLKKRVVAITYRGEDKPGFLKKLALKFKDPGNTTLFVLDKFDGNSELVAELVTSNGFKAAFAIKDGAEGPRGWKNSGLPLLSPKKTFSLNFDELRDTISGSLGETSDSLSVAFGLAAATGLGLFAFTEIETLLQLVGSAAIIQLITKKLLFAEDRKVTLLQVDEFLNTKVAPKELVDEIKIHKTGVPVLRTYTDADWAGNVDDRTSTSAYISFLGSNRISWCSKKQRAVARSTTEAEYRALANAACETMWLSTLLKELAFPLKEFPQLLCDNLGATYLSFNPVNHSRMKHIQIDLHFVRDLVQNGSLQVRHVHTQDQLADL